MKTYVICSLVLIRTRLLRLIVHLLIVKMKRRRKRRTRKRRRKRRWIKQDEPATADFFIGKAVTVIYLFIYCRKIGALLNTPLKLERHAGKILSCFYSFYSFFADPCIRIRPPHLIAHPLTVRTKRRRKTRRRKTRRKTRRKRTRRKRRRR